MNAIEEYYLECTQAVVLSIQAILDGDLEEANDIIKDKNFEILSFAALDIATSIVQTLCTVVGENDPAEFWNKFTDISAVNEKVRETMANRSTNIKV